MSPPRGSRQPEGANGLTLVTRRKAYLPIDTAPAGALLVRRQLASGSPLVSVVGGLAALTGWSQQEWRRFGMNDHTYFPKPASDPSHVAWERRAPGIGSEHGDGALELAVIFDRSFSDLRARIPAGAEGPGSVVGTRRGARSSRAGAGGPPALRARAA